MTFRDFKNPLERFTKIRENMNQLEDQPKSPPPLTIYSNSDISHHGKDFKNEILNAHSYKCSRYYKIGKQAR